MRENRFGYWNKIGTATKFGASVFDSDLAWGLEVDWDGDGVYSGASESLRMCGMKINRGRNSMIQRSGSGLEVISPGNAVFTLWNDDGRYDGWNANSPLYPNVTYGKDIRLRVRNAVSGEIEYVFAGVVSDIVPTAYGERPQVNIHAEDGIVFLRNYSASVQIQTNVAPHDAIGMVLDDIRWPERWGRVFDTDSTDVINYFWADGERTAGTECQEIADAFFGYFFVDAQGRARFINRTMVEASVADFDESDVAKDISNPQPWINNRNVMKIKVHPYDASGNALLHEYFGTPQEIPAGETTAPIFAEYTFNGKPVAALSIETPVANTDFIMVDSSDVDKTSQCSMTAVNLGTAAKITITNNSASTVYVTKRNIRGIAVYEKSTVTVTYPSDPSTVVQPRHFVMDLRWQQSSNKASDFCSVQGPFMAGLHPVPAIQVESNFALQFGKDLFNIVTMTSGKLGIDGVSFRIGGISHETLTENCQRVRTTFYLEPYVGGGVYGEWPLVWGESTFGW